jgi:hypothetical protein
MVFASAMFREQARSGAHSAIERTPPRRALSGSVAASAIISPFLGAGSAGFSPHRLRRSTHTGTGTDDLAVQKGSVYPLLRTWLANRLDHQFDLPNHLTDST